VAVALQCEGGRGRTYAARLRADARRLMALAGVAGCELSIVIGGDDFVHALNREFRGKDRPTDVLSFSQLEETTPGGMPSGLRLPPGQAGLPLVPAAGAALGDVVISVDTARRQARRLGVAPAARMRTLLVHGLLHLLGYDHERSPAEARRMFARERELAAALRRSNSTPRASKQRISGAHGAAKPRGVKPKARSAKTEAQSVKK
jgi:rRNA maturation RNase YbeY